MSRELLSETLLCSPELPEGMSALHHLAGDIYRTARLPSARDEEWKFTSPKVLQDLQSPPSLKIEVSDYGVSLHPCLVFVNGYFHAGLSTASAELLSHGIILHGRVCDESSISEHYEDFFRLYPLAAASAYSMASPVSVEVQPHSESELQLLFIGCGSEGEPLHHHGHYIDIDVGCGASLSLFENHVSHSRERSYIHHDFLRLRLASESRVIHHKLQDIDRGSLHFGHVLLDLDFRSRYDYGLCFAGGALARQDWQAHFRHASAEVDIKALLLPCGGQTHHVSTCMQHHVGDAGSRQQVKVIAADSSRASYQGKLHIARGADASVAHQHVRGLLLDNRSRINTKPELEIFADKVECAHGSAIGALQEEPLFYLQSRGLTYHQACNLLLRAYIDEIAETFTQSHSQQVIQDCLRVKIEHYASFIDGLARDRVYG